MCTLYMISANLPIARRGYHDCYFYSRIIYVVRTPRTQVIPKADFECEEKGCRTLSNVYDSYAESMYDVLGSSTCGHGPVKGKIRVASWSSVPEEAPALLYYMGGVLPTVNDVQCVDNTQPSMMEMYHGGDLWGSVVECMNGPELSRVRDESADNAIVSPATILLTRSSDKKVYLIVEETSINPSFLYSVWTAGRAYDGYTELHHEFHIAATTRLVEAVVTAVVHGEESGQYAFEMVRMWSECGEQCDNDLRRARPFGEHHTNIPVRVEILETIECGLESNADAFVCLLYIISLAAVGIATSLWLRCSTGIDVYDRDELLRAVSTPGGNNLATTSSGIRMFVQKEDTGNLSVVIRDKTNDQPVHPRIVRMGVVNLEEDVESGRIEDDVSLSMRISGRSSRLEGSQTAWAPEQQSSTAKQFFEWTDNSPTVVAQSISPTPTSSDELTITPVHDRGAPEDTDIAYPGSTWARAASTFFSRSLSGRRA